jgi:hypothetical protein
MDLLSTKGSSPPTDEPLRVQTPLPAGYDWTTAASINFSVDGPTAFGARVDVAPVLSESAQHPPGSYLFGRRGWMDPADVWRTSAVTERARWRRKWRTYGSRFWFCPAKGDRERSTPSTCSGRTDW